MAALRIKASKAGAKAGAGQLQAHGVALEECEVSNMTVQLAKPFEETANELRAIGWLDTSATHVAASTAAGDGLKSATVGKEAVFVVTTFEVGGAGKKRTADEAGLSSLTPDSFVYFISIFRVGFIIHELFERI